VHDDPSATGGGAGGPVHVAERAARNTPLSFVNDI
jgi:hypothetical protein